MKLSKLLYNIDVLDLIGNKEIDVENIQYDSRKVTNGSLFICIKGFSSDGHDYIDFCIEKGAKVFLVQDDMKLKCNKEVTYIRVKDTRVTMAKIASNFYNSPTTKMDIIGVTGTNGKTSITTFVKQILDENSKVGLVGTINIYDGEKEIVSNNTTPESVDLQKYFRDMIYNGCEYCAMEVSSHSLSLNRVEDIDFNIGIFTNLTPDHLDFHRDLEDYRKAKEKLFYKTRDANIINIDDGAGEIIYNNIKNLKTLSYSYGIEKDADFKAKDINLSPEGVHYTVVTPTYEEKIFVPVPGKFTVYNTLAVIATCYVLNVPIETINKILNNTQGVTGRFESVKNELGISVIVDYAHTPDALENVLKTAKEFAKGRIITVFGCGGDRDRAKRPLMGKIAQDYSDISIVTNDNPRTENPDDIIKDIIAGMDKTKKDHMLIKDRREAIYLAIEEAQKNDIVMIVGKGHEDYQIIGTTKHHFDDKEVAKEGLDKKTLKSFVDA